MIPFARLRRLVKDDEPVAMNRRFAMVAAKSLGLGILVATLLSSVSSEAGEIISAGSGVRIFVTQRTSSIETSRTDYMGTLVQAGSNSTVSSTPTPRVVPPPQDQVSPPPVARFVPVPQAAYSAPISVASPELTSTPAAAISAPASSYDAYVNLGTSPFAGQSSLTIGEARPWFASDAASKAYGGVPTAQQVQDFGRTVIDRVASTFAKSGLAISVTDDPSARSDHMLSVASGLSASSNPDAIGVSTVGRDGFSFIDKLGYATSADELMWAVAHNVAHELMHAFGGSHHTTVQGGNLDAAVADWSVLIDPETKFSAESIAELTRTLRQGGAMTRSGMLAQELDHKMACHCTQCQILHINGVPVPEPTTIALWAGMAGLGVLVRRRRRDVA
jgi:hypothetical protein